MKAKIMICLVFGFLYLSLSEKAGAWSGGIHSYLCPSIVQNNCGIADDYHFKTTYIYGNLPHLCLDNKADCLPRLVAKYYLKKYYLEDKQDSNSIGAAAHLMQDADCPDHWYPMREYLNKRIFVPFAPAWLTKTETAAENIVRNPTFNYPFQYRGQTINLNKNYLDAAKTEIAQFVIQEPNESLEILAKQIKAKNFWQTIRSYREVGFLAILIILPIIGYSFWHFKKTGKDKLDLVIELVFTGLILLVIIFGYLFY